MSMPKKTDDSSRSNESKGQHYSPLATGSKQLRLLTILPSTHWANDVRCLLSHADLAAPLTPSYETISYVWGNPSRTGKLLVDDIEVTVPASSVAALRRMRLPDSRRVVWLDAICINQRDESERNQQVTMMGDIYRFGTGNLIYLGEEDIGPALDGVDAILQEAESMPDSFLRMRSEAGAWQYASVGLTASFEAKTLVGLYSMAWFRRLWVLQEAALAKKNTCYCGSSVVELVRLTRVAAWLIYNYYFVDSDLRLQCSYAADMNDLVDTVYGYHNSKSRSEGREVSVLYLLDLAQQRLSSVAADKFYGILGLIAESDGQKTIRIQPDYNKTTAEVYRQAAWGVIELRGDLEILDYVRHWTKDDGELEIDEFKSWVPKWHRSKDLEEHANFMSLTFDACLGRKAVVHSQQDASIVNTETLTVSGIYIAKIAQTSERIKSHEGERTKHVQRVLHQVETMLEHSRPEHPTSRDESFESSVAIAMCAGVDSSYRPATSEFLQGYRSFRNHCSREDSPQQEGLPSSSHSASTQDNRNLTTPASQYSEAMYNACMNRKFFTTSQGQYGLGPHFLREGDEIAVLYGLRWPAVLRRVGEDDGRASFVFLGTAYCRGIMHGEAVEASESLGGGYTPDVFCIR